MDKFGYVLFYNTYLGYNSRTKHANLQIAIQENACTSFVIEQL